MTYLSGQHEASSINNWNWLFMFLHFWCFSSLLWWLWSYICTDLIHLPDTSESFCFITLPSIKAFPNTSRSYQCQYGADQQLCALSNVIFALSWYLTPYASWHSVSSNCFLQFAIAIISSASLTTNLFRIPR